MTATTTETSSPTHIGVSDNLKKEAMKQFAIRHAVAVASASVEKMLTLTANPTQVVHLSRQLNEFQQSFLRSESEFLNCLSKMETEQKLRTLFELFDSDASGTVSCEEMATALNKMANRQESFRKSLSAASSSIAAYDIDGDGEMDLEEFMDFVLNLMTEIQAPLEDFCQFLALKVGFADSGTAVLDDAIVALIQDSTDKVNTVDDLEDAVVEVRMIILYQLLDLEGTGYIKIGDVIKSLGQVLDFMDEAPRQALLMYAEGESASAFDYAGFSSLLLNILAASSLHFHDMANEMTLNICKSESSNRKLFHVFEENDLDKLSMDQDSRCALDADMSGDVDYRRIRRLFDLWDLDRSGYIEFSELALGLRKFHDLKGLDDTVEESLKTILSHDVNNDQKLDPDEFATLLVQLARSSQVTVRELVDFMLVEFVLKDNEDEERLYIESVKTRVLDKAKELNRKVTKQEICGGVRGMWASLNTWSPDN